MRSNPGDQKYPGFWGFLYILTQTEIKGITRSVLINLDQPHVRVGRDRYSEGSTLTLLNGCEDIRSNTFLILMSHPIPVWCADPKVNFNGSPLLVLTEYPLECMQACDMFLINKIWCKWGDIIPLIILHYISLHFSRLERETFCRLDEISDHVREGKQVSMLEKGKELCSL